MTSSALGTVPSPAIALLRAIRVRQWVKNLLVVAAPLAAGRLLEPDVALDTLAAVASFCLASSTVYLCNDVADAEADRLHPRKRFRPIAAGHLTPPAALASAVGFAALSLLLAASTGPGLLALMIGYLVLQLAYAYSLKHQPVLDITVVASGFLLRAVAGGLASHLALSQWFLLVAGFGSLFIVAGKRYSELQTLGSGSGTRRSLVLYTPSYLRFVWSAAAGGAMMAYCLWAFRQPHVEGIRWEALSVAPFVVGVLRYAVDVDAGRAGEPEDIIWHDRVLQVIGVVWLVCVCIGVSGG